MVALPDGERRNSARCDEAGMCTVVLRRLPRTSSGGCAVTIFFWLIRTIDIYLPGGERERACI